MGLHKRVGDPHLGDERQGEPRKGRRPLTPEPVKVSPEARDGPDDGGATVGDFSQQNLWNLSWEETRSADGGRRKVND